MSTLEVWKQTFIKATMCAVALIGLGAFLVTRYDQGTSLPNLYKRLTIQSIMRIDASAPPCSSVFIGDSITQGLAANAVAEHSLNYGISFAGTQDINNILPKLKATRNARTVFLLIGTNDIRDEPEERMVAQLTKTSDLLPSNIPLIWSSIPPQREESLSKLVHRINAAIEKLCSRRSNCFYLDTHQVLMNGIDKQSGRLGDSFEADGIHLSREGYAEWIMALRAASADSSPCQSSTATE